MVALSAISIRGSVGYKARNDSFDVRTIQGRLNALMAPPRVPLAVDGSSGPRTEAMILDFQKTVMQTARPDAVVDAGGATLRALNDPTSAAKWAQSSVPIVPPPILNSPPKYVPKAAMNTSEVIEWFKTEIIPQRTASAGRSVENVFRDLKSSPNGICGAAAGFVWDVQPSSLDGIQIGYVLWVKIPFVSTHIANIILPKAFRIREFERGPSNNVVDVTPPKHAGHNFDWPTVSKYTVLDLYFKKVQTLDQWWREVSYAGFGTLTLDPNGMYINDGS